MSGFRRLAEGREHRVKESYFFYYVLFEFWFRLRRIICLIFAIFYFHYSSTSPLQYSKTIQICGSGFPAAIRHSGIRRRRISGIQDSRLAFLVFTLCSMPHALCLLNPQSHISHLHFRNPQFEIRNSTLCSVLYAFFVLTHLATLNNRLQHSCPSQI